MGLISYFDLESIKNEYNCSIFVETGTFKGEGVEYALRFGFEKIYSIEIFDELADKAKEKFKEHKNVEIVHASSYDGLIKIVSELDGNVIFWLDAHFPGSDLGKKTYDEEKNEKINMPLVEELKILSNRDALDVIIIDDLRTFKEVPHEFKHRVTGFNEHMRSIGQPEVTKENLVNFNLDEEVSNLFSNRTRKEVWDQSGFLCILPERKKNDKV